MSFPPSVSDIVLSPDRQILSAIGITARPLTENNPNLKFPVSEYEKTILIPFFGRIDRKVFLTKAETVLCLYSLDQAAPAVPAIENDLPRGSAQPRL